MIKFTKLSDKKLVSIWWNKYADFPKKARKALVNEMEKRGLWDIKFSLARQWDV